MILNKSTDKDLGKTVKLLWLINAEHEKNKIAPLLRLQLLDDVAWKMVQDVAKRRHLDDDERTQQKWSIAQIRQAGYKRPIRGGDIAANVAYTVPLSAIFSQWTSHEGYNGNITNANFGITGLACKGDHWVQMFLRER